MAKKSVKSVLFLSGLALEFAFTIIGGIVAGFALDKWFNTKPYLTLIFIAAALIVSARIFVQIIKKAKENMEDEND